MTPSGWCDAGWWYKPDYIINDININSAITSPAHDETLSLTGRNAYFTVSGYAYSGRPTHPCGLSPLVLDDRLKP